MDDEFDFTFFVKVDKHFSLVRYGESMFTMHSISAKAVSKKSLLPRLLLFSSISRASWLFYYTNRRHLARTAILC